MDDKYQIPKTRQPATKQDQLDADIRELVARRDASNNPAEKQKLNAEITKLFAEYQRLKL